MLARNPGRRKGTHMQRTSGRRRMAWLAAAVVSVGLLGSPGAAAVRLPRVVGSHMVLQRDAELPIWGWADPGEQVTVAIAGHEAKATADAKGRWTVKLPPMKVGGPHTMVVQGKTTVKLTDILVGEVWVGSGQSNMQWSLARAANARKEIAAATYPKIRLFNVPRVPAGEPADDVNATWQACMPGTAKGFSAVLYLFGRELHKELGVPVGLINTSWGGTRIEPWTPPCGFAAVPKLQPFVQRIAQANARHKKSVGAALDHIEAWLATARKAQAADERTPPMPTLPRHPLHSHGQPTGLYNGMVAPLVPFAIRGAIWYQGESNCLSATAWPTTRRRRPSSAAGARCGHRATSPSTSSSSRPSATASAPPSCRSSGRPRPPRSPSPTPA